MNVSCGVNSEAETAARPMFVCHHCGMPVCEEHGWVVTADDAFDDGSGQRSRGTREISAPVSRAAMHCPRCAEEFHKGADRRHGWAPPWAQQVGSQA